MREFREHGSVRGALSNERPYRDPNVCNGGEDPMESPPDGESLKDTLDRVRPIFAREIAPLLLARCNVLVVAHGSSLRALIVLIEGRALDQIGEVEIATGEVLCYCVR